MRIIAQNNFGDTVPGGLAGPMGLLMVVLLGIATVLLIRNMNSRLKRLPDSFDAPDPAGLGDRHRAGAGEVPGNAPDPAGPGDAGRAGFSERPTPDGDER